MFKNAKRTVLLGATLSGLAGFLVSGAFAQILPPVFGSFKKGTGGSGNQCPGAYTGTARMTNSQGGIWFTPPSNAISCTATDISGISSPYRSAVQAVRKSDLMSWCRTNAVTFPVTNTTQYQFELYIKNTPPPPTNGQLLSVSIQWQ